MPLGYSCRRSLSRTVPQTGSLQLLFLLSSDELAQGFIQSGLKSSKATQPASLFRQLVPMPYYPNGEKVLHCIQVKYLVFSIYVCCPSSSRCVALWRACLFPPNLLLYTKESKECQVKGDLLLVKTDLGSDKFPSGSIGGTEGLCCALRWGLEPVGTGWDWHQAALASPHTDPAAGTVPWGHGTKAYLTIFHSRTRRVSSSLFTSETLIQKSLWNMMQRAHSKWSHRELPCAGPPSCPEPGREHVWIFKKERNVLQDER